MSLFNVREIFQFAIRIEETGEKFYRTMAQKLADLQVQELFSFLADEETKHREIYEAMVSKTEKYQPLETYPEEYFAYLRAYADNVIFSRKKLEKEIAEINDPSSAIEFAMARELDSILYYQEMKNLVTEQKRASVENIVQEEQRHYLKLSEIKKLTK